MTDLDVRVLHQVLNQTRFFGTPLQRVQIVKGWIDAEGEAHEEVRDVVCSDGLEVDAGTGRGADNGAGVELTTGRITSGQGAGELMAAWKAPNFDGSTDAFYYVRVIQNATCGWSTYDAIRLGEDPDPSVPATICERAWSSPIWIDPAPPPRAASAPRPGN